MADCYYPFLLSNTKRIAAVRKADEETGAFVPTNNTTDKTVPKHF